MCARAPIVVWFVFALAAGCGGDDSMNLEGQFPYFADFRVYHYQNGRAFTQACLYRYRWCEEAGTVEVENGASSLPLVTNGDANATWYEGRLESTSMDEPFRFTWSGAGEQSSFTGEVWLADGFTISSPADGSTVSASSALGIDWTAGSGDSLVAWGTRATCPDASEDIESFAHLVSDSGHVELSPAQFSFHEGCSVELWLERLQRGSGGRYVNIISSQARFVDLFIGP